MLVSDITSQEISFFLPLGPHSDLTNVYLLGTWIAKYSHFQDLPYVGRWLPISIQQVMMSLTLGSLSFAVMQK